MTVLVRPTLTFNDDVSEWHNNHSVTMIDDALNLSTEFGRSVAVYCQDCNRSFIAFVDELFVNLEEIDDTDYDEYMRRNIR